MVRVIWADAFRLSNGWHNADEVVHLAKSDDWLVSDIGYLLHECEDYIILAGKINEDEVFGEITKIPRTWSKIEKLEVKKPKKRELSTGRSSQKK
jgi:hypothetical protein